jgi:hypothetical protein
MTYFRRLPHALTLLVPLVLWGAACSESPGDLADGADASGASTGAGGTADLSSGGSMDSSGGAGVGGAPSTASGGNLATGGDASGGNAVTGGGSSGGVSASGGESSVGTGATGGTACGGCDAGGGSPGESNSRSAGCDLYGPGLSEGAHPF